MSKRGLKKIATLNRRMDVVERNQMQPPPNAIQTQQVVSMSQRVGPIPHPDELMQYQKISPDLVNRIVSMAELEQKERHFAVARSNYSALTVAVVGFATAAFISHNGHQVAAAIIGALDIGGLVGAFLYKGRVPKHAEKA